MTLLKPSLRQVAHVLLGPQRAVRADHRVNAALGRVARHRAQFLVHQRFATHEKQIADVILYGDVDDVAWLPSA